MTLSILVFGRTGQVAREVITRQGDGIAVTALGRDAADLTDPRRCAEIVASAEADVVINAAAYTQVDRAEDEADLAWRVNAVAPGAMARAAAARGLAFLHLSSDYVFDGRADRPWRESDALAPLGAYGRSKAAGERAIAEAGGPHAILRTSWVFGPAGNNFVRTILRAGRARPQLSVVDDQRGGPTSAAALADALLVVARAFAEGHGESGVFHLSGAPEITWYGFAREIWGLAAPGAGPEITPIRSADWPSRAPRPANSVLDCSRIATVYGIRQPDWRTALTETIASMEKEAAA